MDKVRARRLKPYERQKLNKMKRKLSSQVNSRHARIILLSADGRCNRRIAQLADCSPQWVRKVIHRFNAWGIEGIRWYPHTQDRTGQARKFTPEIVEQIVEVVLSPPQQLIGMNEWSLPKLREYLMAEGVVASISLDHLRTLLRQRKVHWRRTKTWKESTDPQFWKKYRAIRRLYKHPPQDGRVICVDEFGPLNLQPRHGHCYAYRDKVNRHRATYNRKLGIRHFLAYYDLSTDRLYGRMTRHKKLPDFLSFMRWVRRRYPIEQTLHVVLDNYGTHCSQAFAAWAQAHNVRLYFTPTNASWLNRIECHFGLLKKFALDNSDHSSHQEQDEAIQSYLLWRNRHRSLNVQSYSPARNCAA